MLCIVVSCLPTVFQRLMLLDYQIRLNFASGVGSGNVGGIIKESTLGPRLVRFYSEWTRTMYSISGALCRIRRTYIHIRNSGRAWQPSPTRRIWIQYRTEHLPIAVENLPAAALATHQPRSNHQSHTHRQNPKLTRDHIHFHEACNHQRNHHRNRNAGHNPRDNRGNHNVSLPETTPSSKSE